MSRGEIHPNEAAFKRHELHQTMRRREQALREARQHPDTPAIREAMKTLHETGEAEVVINGNPVKMTYTRVTRPPIDPMPEGG